MNDSARAGDPAAEPAAGPDIILKPALDIDAHLDIDADSDDHAPPNLGRRAFFGASIAGLMGAAAVKLGGPREAHAGMALRPPGALAEADFLDACTRCFKCSSVCPNRCIKVYGPGAGLDLMFTPYIKARERACILCGECAAACPTGALKPFAATREGWSDSVDMGTARVNESMCYSFHGRTCGACYRACPLAGEAMTIGIFETPHVHPESCVGCGLCEQACLHLPQAIRVVPRAASGMSGSRT